ncbi:trans-sialidase, partial [Trypanosoma cruzi]
MTQRRLATVTASMRFPTSPPFFASCCCYLCGRSCGDCACMKWSAMNVDEGLLQMFCGEYWLHFPWTNSPRGVRGSPFLYCYFAFVLLCALHLLVCVRTLREGCRHDGP